MIEQIKYHLRQFRWKRIKFKSKGTLRDFGRNFTVISPECISIGDEFYAEENFRLQAWKRYMDATFTPEIRIGKKAGIADNCQISCCNKIIIGDCITVGSNVLITDNLHGHNSVEELPIGPLERELYSKGPVYIGNNVLIGRNVCIMPGVTIGDGAVIGANAVVVKDIPPHTICGGIPAKVIKDICE